MYNYCRSFTRIYPCNMFSYAYVELVSAASPICLIDAHGCPSYLSTWCVLCQKLIFIPMLRAISDMFGPIQSPQLPLSTAQSSLNQVLLSKHNHEHESNHIFISHPAFPHKNHSILLNLNLSGHGRESLCQSPVKRSHGKIPSQVTLW